MESHSLVAPLHKHHPSFAFHTLPLSNSHQNPNYPPPSPNPDHPSPILAVAVFSIMGTAFLLLGYYIFVNKCCQSNVHQVSLRSWFTIRHGRQEEDSFIALSPSMWHRGLDESLIQEIPTLQYRRGEGEVVRGNYKCVVCLSDFQEDDTLRVLPTCNHSFHLDCIDIWLQGNSNCPLCRTSISERCTKYPVDCLIVAPSSSPQGSHPYTESLLGSDEDFVVIELGEDDQGVLLQPRGQQERDIPGEVQVQIRSQSPMKMEHKLGKSEPRKRHHVSAMGDECIDVRGKDDQFSIQPFRRSFSLDSATDRHVCLRVQAIIQQQSTKFREISITEEGSDRSLRKSFMSVGHDTVLRKAVLPIEFEI